MEDRELTGWIFKWGVLTQKLEVSKVGLDFGMEI